MADDKEVKSKRDMIGERLKKKYPDREYADDEAMFGQINDDYDEYDRQLGEYRDRESKLTGMFSRDPKSAQFFVDMAQGKDALSGFVNLIGIDGLKEMLEDPAKIEKFAEENRQYVERVAKQKDLEEQWQKNMSETLSMLERKQQETGLSDEEIDAAADWIKCVTNDAVLGTIKPETIDMALKAINHDRDVAAAGEEGEVRGRNTKVQEARLRKPKATDGTTPIGGSNAGAEPMRQNQAMSIFQRAKAAK